MDAGMMEVLEDAFHAEIRALDAAVVVAVHRKLVKEKVCAKIRGEAASSTECVIELLSEVMKSTDIVSLEGKLGGVMRCIKSSSERSWVVEGAPTTTAVLWVVLARIIARLSQLDDSHKAMTVIAAVVSDIVKCLVSMPLVDDFDGGRVHLRPILKGLMRFLIVSVPIRDKEPAIRLCGALAIDLEDVVTSLIPSALVVKGKSYAVDFCREWAGSLSLQRSVAVARAVLVKSRSHAPWTRVASEIISACPKVALLMLEEVESLCTERDDHPSYRRLVLETIISSLGSVSTMDKKIVDKLCCAATVDPDCSLRSLAWKALHGMICRVSAPQRLQIMAIARDTLIADPKRIVGAVALKVLASSSVDDQNASSHDRVQAFLLATIAQGGKKFPSSWIQDATMLLAKSALPMQPVLLLKAFMKADRSGKELISTIFTERLNSQNPHQSDRELQDLAESVHFETITTFEEVIEMVSSRCHKSQIGSDREDTVLTRSSARAVETLTNWSGTTLETGLIRCLLLSSSIFRASEFVASDNRIDVMLQRSLDVLKATTLCCGSVEDKTREEFAATIAMRAIRLVLQLKKSMAAQKTVEGALQAIMTPLVSSLRLQKETIKLLYGLQSPQKQAYVCLVMAQDEAFSSRQHLVAFLSLVGVIACENASFVAQHQTCQNVVKVVGEANEADGTNGHPKDDDYMGSFRKSVALKNRIKHAKDRLISDGLLSAYLPLVTRVIQTGLLSDARRVALWTLGEFMKVSQVVSNDYATTVIGIAMNTEEDAAVRTTCLDVWADLQPTTKPSAAKENGVNRIYDILRQTSTSELVVDHTLKRLQSLVLEAQLRDDRLHDFGAFLASRSDKIKSTVRHFFRNYARKQPASKVASTVFEMSFALVGQERTKRLALEASKYLLDLLCELSIPLDQLQVSLIQECETERRCLDALRLLFLTAPLATAALGVAIRSVDRATSYGDNTEIREAFRQLFAKQLQRTKDKTERGAITDAIAKVTDCKVAEAHHTPRRVPLSLVSVSRLKKS